VDSLTAPRKLRAAHRPARLSPIVLPLVLLVISAVMVYPFLYMLLNSFLTTAPGATGSKLSTAAWTELFAKSDLLRQLVNSGIVTLSALLVILVLSSAAGYGFAKLAFPGASFAFYGLISCLMIPPVSIIIPLYVNMTKVHLIGNFGSAIIAYAAIGIPFGSFLMASFFRSLPDELLDAALCDGIGHIGIFFRIGLPLARPALAAVGVLQFILIWNDLLIGLLFLPTPQVRTITVGIGVLSSGNLTSLSLMMAGSVLSAIPALLVYILFQRYLIRGLTVGVSR
jgi:multiple sugar transport system permease protein/raffinose/stachyose/melibiose transport system permease protein